MHNLDCVKAALLRTIQYSDMQKKARHKLKVQSSFAAAKKNLVSRPMSGSSYIAVSFIYFLLFLP